MICVESNPAPVPEFGAPPAALVVAFLVECLLLKRNQTNRRLVMTWLVAGLLAEMTIAAAFGVICRSEPFGQTLRFQTVEALFLFMWTAIFASTEYVFSETLVLWKRRKVAALKSNVPPATEEL